MFLNRIYVVWMDGSGSVLERSVVTQLDVVFYFVGMTKVYVMLRKDLRHVIDQPCDSLSTLVVKGNPQNQFPSCWFQEQSNRRMAPFPSPVEQHESQPTPFSEGW